MPLTWYPLADAHRHLPNVSGLYVIRFLPTGQEYVGISYNVRQRVMRHRNARKQESLLHKLIKLHGFMRFEAALLEECPIADLGEREIFAIADRNTFHPGGLNLTRGGGKVQTAELVAERRARSAEIARLTHTGAKRSDETRAKMSAASMGKKMSETARTALLAANIGRVMPEVTRTAINAARRKPVWVWPPGAMVPLEFSSLEAAKAYTGKCHASASLLLKARRASRDGYAFAYIHE